MSSSPAFEWMTLPTTLLAGERSACAYVNVNDELFLMGGLDKKNNVVDSVVSYNVGREKWTNHTPLPQPRYACAAAAVNNNQIVVVGSDYNPSGQDMSKTALLYNVDSKSWSNLPDLRIGRKSPACVATNSKVYVIGGFNWLEGRQEDTIEVLDLSSTPGSTTWTVLPARMQKPRYHCAAAVDCNGNIAVTGGFNKTELYLNSLEVFDTRNGVWIPTPSLCPPMLNPREGHAMVALNGGRVLVVMGGKTESITCSPKAEMLCIDKDGNKPPQWIELPPMSNRRAWLAAFATAITATKQSVVIAAGGSDGKSQYNTVELLKLPYPYWDLPYPPNVDDVPLGSLDVNHKQQVETWIENTRHQRNDFETRVAVAIEDIRDGLRNREAAANQPTDQEELEFNRTILDLQDAAAEYYSKIKENMDRANRIVTFVNSLSKPSQAAASASDTKQNGIVVENGSSRVNNMGPSAQQDLVSPPPTSQEPKPPSLSDPSLSLSGVLDSTGHIQIEEWIDDAENKLTEYQSQVKAFTTEVLLGLATRKAERTNQIAQLRRLNEEDEVTCQEKVSTLKREADDHFTTVHKKMKRTRGFIDWLKSTAAEDPSPPPDNQAATPSGQRSQQRGEAPSTAAASANKLSAENAVESAPPPAPVDDAKKAASNPWSEDDWMEYRKFMALVRPSQPTEPQMDNR